MQKHAVIGAILILLVSAIATIYYLAKSNFLSYVTGVFWYGVITGFTSCLFRLSLILIISLKTAKTMPNEKRGLVFSLFISSGSFTAILFFFKPGDSDVWWYGSIAGFFSCLVSVFFILIIYFVIKLNRNREYSP